MLGDRIRTRRQELRLSQQQLAGKEMTRSFISLVESGKSAPSPESLRVIAQRLGKPVEYFLYGEGTEQEYAIQTALALVESAERDLDASGQALVESAERKLQHALRTCTTLDRTDVEAKVRSLLMQCHRRARLYEEMLDQGESTLDCFKRLGDAANMAVTYHEMARAAFYLEEYGTARRNYERAVLYTEGLKAMQELRVQSLLWLGTSLFRLGNLDEAMKRYRQASDESSVINDPALQGHIAMSLGWVLFRASKVEEGLSWTRRAFDLLRGVKSQDAVLAQHNLGIVLAARGSWEEAYGIFERCLETYKSQGRLDKQASVLEELCFYWIQRGDLVRAEAQCWAAVDLLDLETDSILRGRLYRLLGILARRRGDLLQAKNLLRMSLDILRRLKSTAEVELTLAELETVLQQMVASAG